MIPKKIHYCWFGRAHKSKLAEKCIASWRKYCPDYEIIEWNEENFNVQEHPYTMYCYERKKWAFLSDYVRLFVVSKYGGIYLDTDVEIIKPLDSLLNHEAYYGFENSNNIATGLGFGAVAHHITTGAMLKEYDKLIADDIDEIRLVGCPRLNTSALLEFGLKLNGEYQSVAGAEILSKDYLNPLDDATGVLMKTEHTYSVHWYAKSALSKTAILRSKFTRPFHRLFGENCFNNLKNLIKRG